MKRNLGASARDTSRQSVATVVGPGGLRDRLDPGAVPNWADVKNTLVPVSQVPRQAKTSRKVPHDIEESAIEDYVAGLTPQQIAEKYELTETYVATALARRYPNRASLREALAGMSAVNALACAQHAAINLGEMSAVQAVGAHKIFVETHLKLEEFTRDQPKTVDFDKIERIGATLANLERFAQIESD